MLVRDIEQALHLAETQGLTGSSDSIDKGAFVHLARRLVLPPGQDALHVLELGGGRSYLFWQALHQLGLMPVQAVSLEHDSSLVNQQKQTADSACIQVEQQTLKQISDEGWRNMFANPGAARQIWQDEAVPLPESQYWNYTIRNTFYGEAHQLLTEEESIDVMIVDGPHGNGRSLAYPLFASAMKPGGYILIDDFDHYPFVADMGSLFHYKELHREAIRGQRWVLVQLLSRKK